MNAIPRNSDTASRDFRLLINGRLVAGDARLEVINPATGQILTHCARADRGQLEAAVAAARTAFRGWSATPIDERRRLLAAVAAALADRREAFARLLTEEQGKPLAQAQMEVGGSVAVLQALAQLPLEPRVLRESEAQRVVRHPVPLGVVAAITPWNFPLLMQVAKITPALLAGNTVVSKPAPTTPLTALALAEICAEHLPAGVLNVIVDANDLGDALSSHPDVAKVAFTGSTATGRAVMASSASTLKRITLELGGNDAAIVLDDVDPAEIAPRLFKGAMSNCGQICVAIKRLFVPESLYDDLCARLAEIARSTVVGDGLDPATELGPLQNRRQFERVVGLVDHTRRCGTVMTGGETRGEGYFLTPAIVRDIPDDARLVREEQFGPVLPVLKYSSVEDAIRRANDTEYGLGGSVWSPNLERAHEVAMRLDTGSVWVNKSSELLPDVAMGGAKQSGLGYEFGARGLEEFTQGKLISVSRWQ